MTKQEVLTLIDNNQQLNEFISNNKASMSFSIEGVAIYIFKEDVGTSFYYRLPYNDNANYALIVDFMRYAIPYLSQKLEEKRKNKLFENDF